MRVRCVINTGTELSKIALKAGELITSRYEVTIGALYVVYGIALWNGALQYLTMDRHLTLPFWHPAELFQIEDNILPIEWYHQFFGYKENVGLSALWGYKELVLDENHYDNLIERKNEAVRIFLKRKAEIDDMYQ